MLLSKSLFIIILFVSLSSAMTVAQPNKYMGHIGLKDGLVSQLCTGIIEDDLGNLWISSFQDVQKYNGYSVKVFPLYNHPISNLQKDLSGKIWAIQSITLENDLEFISDKYHQYKRINIINPLTDSISQFNDHIPDHVLQLASVTKIIFHSRTSYFITKNDEVFSYKDSLTHYATGEAFSNILSITKNGLIVSYNKSGLQFQYSNGSIADKIESSKLKNYDALVISDTGKIFLLKEIQGKLRISEYDKKKIQNLIIVDRDLLNTSHLKYLFIERYNNGDLIISGHLFQKIKQNEYEYFETPKTINEYYLGNAGLGYATTNLGIYVLNNKKKLFKNLSSNTETLNSVRGIYIDEHIQAFKVYDHETISSKSNNYSLSFLDNYDLGYQARMHYRDPLHEHQLWSIGAIPDKLRMIDFVSNKVNTYNFIPESENDITCILRSSTTSDLYLSSTTGSYIFDEEQQTFYHFKFDCLDDKGYETNHIIQKGNEIWFASSQGLIMYNEITKSCTTRKFLDDEIPHTIQYIHQDKVNPNIIWIGYRREGLVKWNTVTDSIVKFDTTNGLSNNDVHAILEDKTHRLWISTNTYLNCLNKQTNRISVYTEQDGLSHSEFNRHSCYQDTAGNTMYFGGLNGYNYFNPDSISITSANNKINVRIVDAIKTKSNGTAENIFSETVSSNYIEIFENDVSLEIDLSTNYLFGNDYSQYSYRINGIRESWKTQSSNSIKLNRLPYGKFKLELIADLYKPAFTSNILTIELNIIKPFTKTWTFFIISILSFLYLLWLMVRAYIKSLRVRNLKLEAIVSERTEELQQVISTKNKIFAILAHDLRNPISNLTNLTDKIKFLAKYNRVDELNIIAEQSKSRINALNDNLNNILHWALSDQNMLLFNPQKLSLLLEINKVLQLYAHSIEEKNIQIKFELEDVDQVYLDVSLLQTLLRNFISNAIKFSYEKGTILFSKSHETNSQIELTIEDNGIGMNVEDNQDQESNKIRNKGKGSGIGLLISKELIDKSGINLTIKSSKSKGTIIQLIMPKNSLIL